MTKDEIAELFTKCLALHNRYQYQEEKDNLQKFVETDPEELSNFIETYNKTEKYNNREAEIFHSLSSILISVGLNSPWLATIIGIKAGRSKGKFAVNTPQACLGDRQI